MARYIVHCSDLLGKKMASAVFQLAKPCHFVSRMGYTTLDVLDDSFPGTGFRKWPSLRFTQERLCPILTKGQRLPHSCQKGNFLAKGNHCTLYPENLFAMLQQGIRMMPQLLTEHTRFYVTAPLSARMT